LPSVLFVCTANRCRSPMATALFKDLLGRSGLLDRCRVESAGTWAEEGQPATSLACQAMRERGLDLSDHRSRRVSGELLSAFDLILVMEQGHQEALRVEFPEVKDRVHLLAGMTGEDFTIPDPYGGTIETYRALTEELADVLQRGLPRIRSALDQA
jgi:protein-tyrosine phosphatase